MSKSRNGSEGHVIGLKKRSVAGLDEPSEVSQMVAGTDELSGGEILNPATFSAHGMGLLIKEQTLEIPIVNNLLFGPSVSDKHILHHRFDLGDIEIELKFHENWITQA